MLFPPVNYSAVEDGLYRSGFPTEINYAFLERLELKTIVYLFPDEIDVQFETFVEDQGISLICLGEEDSGEHQTKLSQLAEETVLEALALAVDAAKYPLLITCSTGKHRTGTVVACLRKLQRWSITSIFEEYRRFTKHKTRVQNEQFIELFDTDLVRIPVTCAPFLREIIPQGPRGGA